MSAVGPRKSQVKLEEGKRTADQRLRGREAGLLHRTLRLKEPAWEGTRCSRSPKSTYLHQVWQPAAVSHLLQPPSLAPPPSLTAP